MPSPDPVTAAGRDALAAHFGARLKYWRRTRRRTQAELARDLDVDGSYVSKLESSARHPNLEIAARCDRLLDTGGELAGLLALMGGDTPAEPQTAIPVPLLWSAPAGPPTTDEFQPRPNPHTAVTLTRLLEAYVDIDCTMGGQQIGAAVEQQAQDIIRMQIGAAEPVRHSLLTLAAKYARLAGWIRFDHLDRAGSLFWHDCGQRWALAGDNPDLAAELLARQSIVHSSTGDHHGAIALASTVEHVSTRLSAIGRTWALLAQARTYAIAGHESECLDRLSRARKLFDADVTGSLLAAPASHRNPYLWHTFEGKCHLDLATRGVDPTDHAQQAIASLGIALGTLSTHHVRDRALTRLRLARAQVCAGNLGQAREQLGVAEDLALRCSSKRLHAAVRRIRELAAGQ